MINAITTALMGLAQASKQVDTSAQRIAENASPDGLIEDIIDIKLSQTAFEANLAMIKTANDLSRELLHAFDEEV